MLKFAANLSLLFTELELSQRFKAASHHGFQAVEIQFPYALSPAQLKTLLKAAEVKLILFNVAADDLLQGGEGLACVPDKQVQFKQAVQQALAYAEELQPVAINVLPGRCHHPQRLADYKATLADNLYYAAEAFASVGVKTVFEAINSVDMPGFIITSGQHMLDMLAQVQHPNLLMQYDIYHATKMAGTPDAFISQHAGQIGHIQFADCPGRGQPGTGTIDFKHLFSVIEQSAYGGWLGAEYLPVGSTADSLAWLPKQSIHQTPNV